jgi:hypothetical protein
MIGVIGEEGLAAALGGSAVVGGAVLGPVWGTALDVGSALLTAGVALHGAHRAAGMGAHLSGHRGHRALEQAARRSAKGAGAHPAALAMDVLCRIRSRDGRAVRSAAILVGRCASSHADGFVAHVVTSFCRGLRPLSTLRAGAEALRAAREHADVVRAMKSAVSEPVTVTAEPSPASSFSHDEDASEPSLRLAPSWEMQQPSDWSEAA